MATFITLTLTGGKAVRVNAERIYTYERMPEILAGPNKREEHTMICIGAGEDEFFRVTETPEQIDAMLGVTADAAPEREQVRWYCFGDDGFEDRPCKRLTADRNIYVIPEGEEIPAGLWRYEHTDVDARGKFILLHRAIAARGE